MALNSSCSCCFSRKLPKAFYFDLWNNQAASRASWLLKFQKLLVNLFTVCKRKTKTWGCSWRYTLRCDQLGLFFFFLLFLTDGKVRSVSCNETQCKCGCRLGGRVQRFTLPGLCHSIELDWWWQIAGGTNWTSLGMHEVCRQSWQALRFENPSPLHSCWH